MLIPPSRTKSIALLIGALVLLALLAYLSQAFIALGGPLLLPFILLGLVLLHRAWRARR